MGIRQTFAGLATGLGLLLAASTAAAQWELDNDSSSLNFISIKNDAVAETHRFGSLVGFVGADGAVQLGIDLASVDTGIEIRDQRMREMLFDTAKFTTANVTGQVDPAILSQVEPGTVLSTDLEVNLSLHGVESKVSVPVVVIGESTGLLRVITARPVLLSANNFDLLKGVAALQEVAGLNSISTAVPVTFHLVFKPASSS
ncbi:YceI family protein [Parahaliea aestuarii]|uniref:YceI family protein n=1 Tax=Parahaliea aestuarii TaxID=1852021 RepID=A0A5C8ZYY5_9GAMM|nr:YceI family protein [Parahaliea aestuarii]TXS92451.1 YceI family protein [Parahaliea aestuarii]